jgi:hypothetical protein
LRPRSRDTPRGSTESPLSKTDSLDRAAQDTECDPKNTKSAAPTCSTTVESPSQHSGAGTDYNFTQNSRVLVTRKQNAPPPETSARPGHSDLLLASESDDQPNLQEIVLPFEPPSSAALADIPFSSRLSELTVLEEVFGRIQAHQKPDHRLLAEWCPTITRYSLSDAKSDHQASWKSSRCLSTTIGPPVAWNVG